MVGIDYFFLYSPSDALKSDAVPIKKKKNCILLNVIIKEKVIGLKVKKTWKDITINYIIVDSGPEYQLHSLIPLCKSLYVIRLSRFD